jgi:hypothetical protein
MSFNKCTSKAKGYVCGTTLTDDNWCDAFQKKECYTCVSCHALNCENTNSSRMYVNGKFVSKKHPMHKPGRYKANEGSFFDVVPEDGMPLAGWVYIITNEAWPEWVKVGMADDAEKRLSGYQTGSPMRDYAIFGAYEVNDRRAAEKAAHDILKVNYRKKGEWFMCNPAVADVMIRGTMEEFSD